MDLISERGLFERTRRRLTRSGDAALRRLTHKWSPDLPDKDAERLADEIRACVSPTVGEMTARRGALEIGDRYRCLNDEGRTRFFDLLASDFGVDRHALDTAVAARQKILAGTPVDSAALLTAERDMRRALRSPRALLFGRFNGLEEGVKFLVDLRSDLRDLRRNANVWTPEFKEMDAELHDILSGWFDVGNLELRQISWDTPASILEKLIQYESVHEITSWDDLRNRLDPDRRCYAFFHPGMPDEPLIFVEVALTKGIAGNLGELLDVHAPEYDIADADTAIFYSISNCQAGLAGVNLGDLLIKRVVGALTAELPQLATFSTLSPITGFRPWLSTKLQERDPGLFTSEETFALRTALGTTDVFGKLDEVLDRPDWHWEKPLAEALHDPLLRLSARYVTQEKRGQRALDRVANFHLSNGARVERLNWKANLSPVGLSRSAGIMANYRYVTRHIPENHTRYVTDGQIHISSDIEALLSP